MRLLQIFITFFVFLQAIFAVERPNIILMMADDQGWGDTGYNGHPFLQTPHMDAMSKVGLRMDRFYAAAPNCSPTRASVMTGRTPVRTNVVNHGHYIRDEEETIAEVMKRSGYATGHFGKWHMGSVQKQSPVSPGGCGFDEWLSAPNFFDIDPWLSDKGIANQYKGISSEIITNKMIQFIQKNVNQKQPFFAVLWFSAPHAPFQISKKSPEAKLYNKVDKNIRGYYQEISEIDRMLGLVRKELKNLKIKDNTLLWYCSDNGGLVHKSSGGRAKKGSIYEGGLRVPSLIEWPNKIKPMVTNTPSNTSDIFPTLLKVIGAKKIKNHRLDGIDISPMFTGQTIQKRGMGFWHGFANGQLTYSDQIVKEIHDKQKQGIEIAIPSRIKKAIDKFPQYNTGHFPGHSAWLEWPWKIHLITNKKTKEEKFELYNIENDAMESKDLFQKQPERAKQLQTKLTNWQNSVLHSLNGKEY